MPNQEEILLNLNTTVMGIPIDLPGLTSISLPWKRAMFLQSEPETSKWKQTSSSMNIGKCKFSLFRGAKIICSYVFSRYYEGGVASVYVWDKTGKDYALGFLCKKGRARKPIEFLDSFKRNLRWCFLLKYLYMQLRENHLNKGRKYKF